MRKGTELKAEVPTWAGRVVSMVEHKGQLLVACERGVFMLSLTDCVLRPLRFVDDSPVEDEARAWVPDGSDYLRSPKG